MITCLYRVSSAYGSPTLIFAESEDEALNIAIKNRWVINKTKAKLEKLDIINAQRACHLGLKGRASYAIFGKNSGWEAYLDGRMIRVLDKDGSILEEPWKSK